MSFKELLKNRYFHLSLVLLMFLFIFFLAHHYKLKDFITVQYIQKLFEERFFISLLIFANLFALTNLLHIPGWVMLAGAVYALGKVQGGLVTYMGAIYACSVIFLFIRLTGKATFDEFKIDWMNRVFKRIDTKPIRNLFLLRIIGQTAPILNYALGLSKIKFRHYLIGTMIGLPIPIIVNVYFFEFFIDLVKN